MLVYQKVVTFFEHGILIAIMKKHHLPHISMTFLGHTAAISSVSSGCSKLYCSMSMVILSTVGIQGGNKDVEHSKYPPVNEQSYSHDYRSHVCQI